MTNKKIREFWLNMEQDSRNSICDRLSFVIVDWVDDAVRLGENEGEYSYGYDRGRLSVLLAKLQGAHTTFELIDICDVLLSEEHGEEDS